MLAAKFAFMQAYGVRMRKTLRETMSLLPRLYIESPLHAGMLVEPNSQQVHYLRHVLRLKQDADVLLFNGCDGEWRAQIVEAGKKLFQLNPVEQVRQQAQLEDIHYLFAPLKHARLDYMAQKATEMGVSCLQPVFTQNTQVSRVNIERVKANAIEAAEQCELLSVPHVMEPQQLDACLGNWQPERKLILCDEQAAIASPYQVLQSLKDKPCAVLVGPEGGFTEKEREKLLRAPFTIPISLGPRILRADTAAVAALAMLWLAR